MCAGFRAGTSSTSVFVANVTGRVQRPSRKSACGSAALAEAKTSAVAPRWISRCRMLEPEVVAGAAVDRGEGVAERGGRVDGQRLGGRRGREQRGGGADGDDEQ